MKNKYLTLIITCWVVLIICFFVKLLGGNFFEIATENKNFIKFCQLVDKNIFLYYIISMLTYSTSNALIIFSMLKVDKSFNKFKLDFIPLSLILIHLFKFIFPNNIYVSILTDILALVAIPLVINVKCWKRIITGNILVLIFQIISLLTKNIGLKIIDSNTLTSLIFMIDYYIMIILYYLYSTKERSENNGSIWRIFSWRKRNRSCENVSKKT